MSSSHKLVLMKLGVDSLLKAETLLATLRSSVEVEEGLTKLNNKKPGVTEGVDVGMQRDQQHEASSIRLTPNE